MDLVKENEALSKIFERLEVMASGRAPDVDYQKRRLIDVIIERMDDVEEISRSHINENVGMIISALAAPEVYGYYIEQTELRKWPVYIFTTRIG